jgi:hypothetical protein
VVPVQLLPSAIRALLLLYVGRHAEAREELHAIRRWAQDRGDESDLAFVGLWMSWLETRSGNLEEAYRLANEALSLAVLTESPSMHAWALTQRALVHAYPWR